MGARLCREVDIGDLLDEAIESCEDSWALTEAEYDNLYLGLLGYYLSHGYIPEFSIQKAVIQ